jgi:plasmid stabilization system protein ParE
MSKKRYVLKWTTPAERDLLSTVEFIKEDNVLAARTFGNEIRTKVKRLMLFRYSGRIVPEFMIPTLREIIVRDYRIIYRLIPEKRRIEILTVFHGSRQFPMK